MRERAEVESRQELIERIRLLEFENELFAARAEDLLLLGLIGERIQSFEGPEQVIQVALERMALLKDIPFCACGVLVADGLALVAHYSTLTDSRVERDHLELEATLLQILENGNRHLLDDETARISILFADSDVVFEPQTLLFIPFVSRAYPRACFVFADDRPPRGLEVSAEMVHRIVDLTVARLDHLALLTELQELNSELDGRVERRTAELRQAQKMESVGRLAGGVAHDFNNLLSTILGYSELSLLKLPEGDPVAENLGLILEAGERAVGLTRQLLAFSRKQVLQMETLQPRTIVDEFGRMLRRIIGEDVDLALRTRPTRSVAADRGQLEQVLLNLAVNARDAMPDGGRLLLQTRDVTIEEPGREGLSPGPYVELVCRDSGVGMIRSVQERIFEPFFTTKEKGKGTGLGLATSYGIIRQHGGAIEVESAPGSGTTFRVLLPAIESDPEADGSWSVTGAMPRGKETVLVVDDDESIRVMIRRALAPLGYCVKEAGDGHEALREMKDSEGRIDLLLSDVIMPGLGGGELAAKVADLFPEVPVVLMTGYPEDQEALTGLVGGGVVLLHKPILPSNLAVVLREILDRPR